VKEKFSVPENWTMDDMIALYEGADEMHYYWNTKEEMLQMLLYGTDFTDEMAGSCHFDSPEYIKMLEFCNRFPENSTCPEKDYEDPVKMEQFDKWINDSFNSFKNDQNYLKPLDMAANTGGMASAFSYAKGELGEPFVMAGYPSDNKQGGKITVSCEIGILSSCKDQAAAWEMLRYYMQQFAVSNYSDGYSIFEAQFREQMDDEMYIMDYDQNGNRIRSDLEYYDDDCRVYPLTQAERDALEQYIRGLSTYMLLDPHVETIAREEAGKYFAGDCSAEDAAKATQSRALLMLSEQSG
ncbi:MAG: hypothetical protein IKN55_11905, partial [Oscillospiraceae bacterium]|nr:hypothetical protein [Oscillospiraceae bacterium]